MGRKATKTVIARLGKDYSYSDNAARVLYGDPESNHSIVFRKLSTFEECLASVSGKTADYAVVPVFNKIIGDICTSSGGPTVKQMAEEMNLSQTQDHKLDIYLVIASNGLLEEVTRVFSKQEALGQCKKFFDKHGLEAHSKFPGGRSISDTAEAAEYVAAARFRYYAAICSPEAARHHKLHSLSKDNIADDKSNYTLFYAYALKP